MIKSPCFECPDRHRLCHSECEKYKAFRVLKDAEHERMRQMTENDAAYFDISKKFRDDWMRKKMRGRKL